ncbi:MAG: helix-turn-helix domain-containing protein [Aeoliella sp.]
MSAIPLGSRPYTASLEVRDDDPSLLAPVLLPGESFFAGEENRLLAAVVGAWCEAIGDASKEEETSTWQRLASPLVLVGSTGSGKSHLAAGLAQLAGDATVHYATANDLRRNFAEAIDSGDPIAWRDELSAMRLLVIDDIDHLPSHGAFQQELLYLMDALHKSGGKLLVTSAQPIAHLRGWLPGLIDRFAAGLTVEIAPLGAQARREILTRLAESCQWEFSPAALDRLVDHTAPEPRELLRLAVELRRQFGDGAKPEDDTLDHFLELRKQAQAPDLREIVRVVGRYYRLPLKLLTSSSRRAPVVMARATVIYLARTLTSASYDQLGRLLGGRDHTTIMHSQRRTVSRLPHDPGLRSAMDDLTHLLRR